MDWTYFDLGPAYSLASSTDGMDELERSLRLLGAAELAATELSTTMKAAPVTVTEQHWRWACQYTMCAFGERPRCLDKPAELQLWHVTSLPGYMQKLSGLGFENPVELGSNFCVAIEMLKDYLLRYSEGVRIVESGALWLQSETWRERLRLLGVDVQHDDLELVKPVQLTVGEFPFAGELSGYRRFAS